MFGKYIMVNYYLNRKYVKITYLKLTAYNLLERLMGKVWKLILKETELQF